MSNEKPTFATSLILFAVVSAVYTTAGTLVGVASSGFDSNAVLPSAIAAGVTVTMLLLTDPMAMLKGESGKSRDTTSDKNPLSDV